MLGTLLLGIQDKYAWISTQYLRYPDSCFEIFGLDITFDQAYRPWLIECNLSPSLDPGGSEKLKREMLETTFRFLIHRSQAEEKSSFWPTDFGEYRRVI